MWVLEDNDTDPDRVIHLHCEVELTVSRKEGINVILLTNDGSISRKHATIKITHNVANVGNPQNLPEVYLTDEGSKYGNYINENIENQMKIEPNNPIRLENNTRIRFGMMHNVWRLVYHPLVVTNSTLDKASKSSLNQALLTLGGHVVGDWTQDCSLLVMNNITLTVKVVCALASRSLIVTPEYFTALIEAIRNNKLHPNPKDYEPPLQEMSIKRSEASFSPNEMRKEVFSGQTFLFTSPKQFKRMAAAVKLAGGQSKLLEEANCNFVSVKGHLLVQLPPEKDLQNNPPVYFTQSKKLLAEKELRCIPESEIGLAVLFCSTEKHCNPAFKTKNIFKRNESSMSESQSNLKIYATETQNTEYSISLTAMPGTRVIPESGQSKPTPPPKNTETAFKTPEPVVLKKPQGSATANISSSLKESSNKENQDEVANKKRGRSGSNELSSPQSKRRNSVLADPNPTQPMDQTQPMDSQEEINDSEIHPETFLAGVKAHSTQKTNRKEDEKNNNPPKIAMRQNNSDESDITNISISLSSTNNNNMSATTGVTTEPSASFPKVLTYEPFTLPTLRTGATIPTTEDDEEDQLITAPFPNIKEEPQSLDVVDGIDDEGWRHGKRKRGTVLETQSKKSNIVNSENDSLHDQSVSSKQNQNRIKRERSLSGDKEAADRPRDIKREKQDEDLFNISRTTSRRNRANPRPVSPAACGTENVQPTPQDNLFNLPTSSRARRKQETSMNNVTESNSNNQGAVPCVKKEVENAVSSSFQNVTSHVAPSGEFIKKKTSPFKRSPSELERTTANNDQPSSNVTENENGMNETLEKSLAVVVFVDLIRRIDINENNKTVNNSSLNNTMVRNFKRFKKNARNNLALPRIIGGTDLKPHDALNDTRKDDWFNDNLEVTQRLEREEEERRQDALGVGWDSGNSNSSGKNTNSNENTANELFSMALTSRRRGRK